MELEPLYWETHIRNMGINAHDGWINASRVEYQRILLEKVNTEDFRHLYHTDKEFEQAVDAIAGAWTGTLGQVYNDIQRG